MSNTNYEELTLDSEVFAQARENFDLLFQRLLKNMEKNNSDEGSITLKVDLEMTQDYVPDGDGTKEVNKPLIKHKITTTVPVKDSFDGKKDTGMDLVWDEELKRYVLKYISVGGQRSIFDPDFQENVNAGADPDEATLLPGPSNALPDNEGIVDAEFKEVEPEAEPEAEESGNETENQEDEQITEEVEENAPGGDTEATESQEDKYDYEESDSTEPEEE